MVVEICYNDFIVAVDSSKVRTWTKKYTIKYNSANVNIHLPPPHTCKLRVTVATAAKLGDQLAVGLKDEDATSLVVDDYDVSVSVHSHAFRTQQLPQTDLVLQK